jgi:acetyltransferase
LNVAHNGHTACEVAAASEHDVSPAHGCELAETAFDASEPVAPGTAAAAAQLARLRYPSEQEERLEHHGRELVLRPIRPEDARRHQQFVARISPEDLQLRFFAGVRELSEAYIERLTHIDYDREMAFIAVAPDAAGTGETLGVARAVGDADNVAGEFAVLVRSDVKGQGIGRLLTQKLIRYCRERGTKRLWGIVMSHNAPMLGLAGSLGFSVRTADGNFEEISLELQSPPEAPD